MMKYWRKTALLTFVFILACQLVALASSSPLTTAPTELTAIRFHSTADKDRIVLDVGRVTNHYVQVDEDGTHLSLDVENIKDTIRRKPPISSDLIEKVTYTQVKTRFKMTLTLKKQVEYNVITLQGPARIVLDIMPKKFQRRSTSQPAPGLWQTKLERRDERGLITAYFLEIDPQLYTLQLALANGRAGERQALSAMSDDNQAVAAINAGYFDTDGTVCGVIAVGGKLAGTTWYTRSALCVPCQGKAFIQPVYYSAALQVGGIDCAISGINCPRVADSLVIYNSCFGQRTKTNAFGMEYTVQRGKVTAISSSGNAAIPTDGYVISVHGTAKAKLAKIKNGSIVSLTEDIGVDLQQVPLVIGAGPLLVKNSAVFNNAAEEEFPADIAQGKAPRTGFALLRNGHYLFAVVDGRQKHSGGCTLDQFAELLVSEGASAAINFDGGGSSEMVIGGKIINKPSDGAERRIGSALYLSAR